jgi:hypothetical protein
LSGSVSQKGKKRWTSSGAIIVYVQIVGHSVLI